MVSFNQAIKILAGESPNEIKEGVCQSCGSTENVTFEADPFMDEIEHDNTPVWLCENCRDESGRDI